MKNILWVCLKELIHLRRDPRIIVTAVIVPAVVTVVFGFAYQAEISHIEVGVVDNQKSLLSDELVRQIYQSSYFEVTGFYPSYEGLKQSVYEGIIVAGIYIPELSSEQTSSNFVFLILDGARPELANIIQAKFGEVLQVTLETVTPNPTSGEAGILVINQNMFLQNPKTVDLYSYGVLGLILTFVPMSLVSHAIVRERESGTIELLAVSPLTEVEIVVGKMVAYLAITLWNIIVVLGLMFGVFHAYFGGNLADLLILAVIFLLGNLGLGLFISSTAKTAIGASGTVFVFLIPSVLFSGFVYPLESFHPSFVWVSTLLPLTYFLQAARAIMIQGKTLADVQLDVLLIGIYSVVSLFLASRTFNRRLD